MNPSGVMLTIQIHDEQLIRRLQQIAERENRPVEDVLKMMLVHYPGEMPSDNTGSDVNEVANRVRRKAYAKARQYWLSVGDSVKAAMTDEELDERFGAFDEEGIPRLRSELKSPEPPVGSLAYAAKVVREMGGIRTEGSIDVLRIDELLNEEFADYLLRRATGKDAAE